MATFKPRLTKPENGNPYYNTKANGGYSNAIKGKPTDQGCDVLANCVGYAYGRFNEIGGYGSCKYLLPVNAENFIQYKGNLEVGQTPKVGACMVWRKGGTLSGSDGAGHVSIVEKVISDTEVVVSESGYNSYAFRTKTRKKETYDNWGAGSGYTFLGFIYNPAECCQGTPTKQGKGYVEYDKSIDGEYTITASALNIREGAGTDHAILVTIPKGTKVKCNGCYSTVSGVKWFHIQFTYNGVRYMGLASSKYLAK